MTRSPSRRRRVLQALAAAVAWPALRVAAQDFPSRPITLIVPYPAGGPTDRHMRHLAELAAPHLGQALMVENRPGAAGTLALGQMAANARADGYTLALYNNSAFRVPLMQKTAWHPMNDFSFVVGVAGYRQALLVRGDSPYRTAQDLFRASRQEHMSYGSAGIGSGGHLLIEQLSGITGASLTHIPFKGSSEMLQALLGGHITAVCDVGGWEALVEDGRLRLLLVFADRPIRRFPNVPTAASQGWTLASELRYGLVAPKDLPPAVQRTLHDGFRKAMADPRHDAMLEQLNLDPWPRSGEAFREWAGVNQAHDRELLGRMGLLAR